jgi:hypothetical protein
MVRQILTSSEDTAVVSPQFDTSRIPAMYGPNPSRIHPAGCVELTTSSRMGHETPKLRLSNPNDKVNHIEFIESNTVRSETRRPNAQDTRVHLWIPEETTHQSYPCVCPLYRKIQAEPSSQLQLGIVHTNSADFVH